MSNKGDISYRMEQLGNMSDTLESMISAYNEQAELMGSEVIVAFKMTLKEREEFLNDNKIQSDTE